MEFYITFEDKAYAFFVNKQKKNASMDNTRIAKWSTQKNKIYFLKVIKNFKGARK